MTNKIDWIVHYVSNNVCCDECGKREDSFLPCLCNAHTHGMKKYNHLDFQIVLDLGAQEVCRILNELGRRVRAGHRFTAGEMIPGVYEDCDVRLDIAEETGREVYRVIIPDRNYLFPEDPLCCGIYPQQLVNTEDLCAEKMNNFIRCGVVRNVRCSFSKIPVLSDKRITEYPPNCMNAFFPVCSQFLLRKKYIIYSIPIFRKGTKADRCLYRISLHLSIKTEGQYFTTAIPSDSALSNFRMIKRIIEEGALR